MAALGRLWCKFPGRKSREKRGRCRDSETEIWPQGETWLIFSVLSKANAPGTEGGKRLAPSLELPDGSDPLFIFMNSHVHPIDLASCWAD